MSVDSACPQTSNSRETSPVPEICEPKENCTSLQMSSAETLHTETGSPLPPSTDLLIQNSTDSPTRPRRALLTPADSSAVKKEKVQVKEQKIRTVFSQTQLWVLNERFQRQKYLSLQQMQKLSNILKLSYKHIKTWFQNQRMKGKRWQKFKWPKHSNHVARTSSAARVPGPLLLAAGVLGARLWKPLQVEQPDLQ